MSSKRGSTIDRIYNNPVVMGSDGSTTPQCLRSIFMSPIHMLQFIDSLDK